HRVVHGGPDFTHATRVDETVLQRLEALNSLAPLHQPHNLAGIRAFQHIFPQVPQVACFDTAFHASLPELETRFALPEALVQQGIRRYGFHGLSYAYLMQR
ncbi:MAG: acetate kinase, partial [Burkholderiales bacterium]